MDYFFYANRFGWPPDVVRRQRRTDLRAVQEVAEVHGQVMAQRRQAAQMAGGG